MKLYYDLFSGEEIVSDGYKTSQIHQGAVLEVRARFVIKKEGEIDIGCGNAFGGGGQEEQADQNVEKVLDLVDTFGYEQTSFDKPAFMAWYKGFMKKVLTHLQEKNADRVEGFKAGAKEFMAFLKDNFDDLTFYTPKSFDTENTIIVSYYKGEDVEPHFYFMLDGLRCEKV